MSFYIQCIFFHQWGIWRRPVMNINGIATYSQIEKRICLRCGKIQERLIKENKNNG